MRAGGRAIRALIIAILLVAPLACGGSDADDEGLWVANADGSGDTHRLAVNGADASWAPDSRRVVFEVRHHFGRYWRRPQSLSVADSTAEDLVRLTYGGSARDNTAWRGDRATP